MCSLVPPERAPELSAPSSCLSQARAFTHRDVPVSCARCGNFPPGFGREQGSCQQLLHHDLHKHHVVLHQLHVCRQITHVLLHLRFRRGVRGATLSRALPALRSAVLGTFTAIRLFKLTKVLNIQESEESFKCMRREKHFTDMTRDEYAMINVVRTFLSNYLKRQIRTHPEFSF